MQKHTKNYFAHFGYDISDIIMCEVCKIRQSVDIHHVIPRSRFGKKRKEEQDNVNNLIALCRECHDKAHANLINEEIKQCIESR